jgi:hypothetical protein
VFVAFYHKDAPLVGRSWKWKSRRNEQFVSINFCSKDSLGDRDSGQEETEVEGGGGSQRINVTMKSG